MTLKYTIRLKKMQAPGIMARTIQEYHGLDAEQAEMVQGVFTTLRHDLASYKSAAGGNYVITFHEIVYDRGGDDDPPVERFDHLTYPMVLQVQERAIQALTELLALGQARVASGEKTA